MTSQLNIDFTTRPENNDTSARILFHNKARINGQAIKVMHLLAYGHRLTVKDAIIEHGISSLPRRILDIEEKFAKYKGDKFFRAERDYNNDRYVVYSFNELQKIKAIKILKGLT